MSAQEGPPNRQGANDDTRGQNSEPASDVAIEGWLSTHVAETFDRMQADPNRGAPLDVAFARLRRARGLQRE